MAGTAKTDRFLISDATIMVGPMASLKSLNPAAHSLGLAKNLQISIETTKTELTQGITNEVVMSVITGNTVTCSAEIYEFTAKNLVYGLGMDPGTAYDAVNNAMAINAAVAAAATTVEVAGDKTTDFPVGKWFFLQEGTDDQVHIAKVSASTFASTKTTITFAGYPVPVGMSFTTANGRIGALNKIDADPTLGEKTFALKAVGVMPSDKTPVTLIMPKVKITKGFSLAFSSQDFGNLPFEFTPYAPVPTDAGYDVDFKQKMHIFRT